MKPKKTAPPIETPSNPVAKFAHLYNKAMVFSDKTKYRRQPKHASKEAYQIELAISPL